MANKKYKGKLSRDLRNVGGQVLKEGQDVIVKRARVYDSKSFWTGAFEYHYQNLEKNILIRVGKLYLK